MGAERRGGVRVRTDAGREAVHASPSPLTCKRSLAHSPVFISDPSLAAVSLDRQRTQQHKSARDVGSAPAMSCEAPIAHPGDLTSSRFSAVCRGERFNLLTRQRESSAGLAEKPFLLRLTSPATRRAVRFPPNRWPGPAAYLASGAGAALH
ncbi:hypothetical protein SKAU_G00394170 [Synaphobranchus kaupii]|uniref:Uncharacterized protein n=1 Tax=Synaphobranchus kaupii TaxID=118154 RepID=A0A9Q1IDX1_SYNKA|nr:hypothetical protein SKAU_G00394170 [Synaphobranchus kaupii]